MATADHPRRRAGTCGVMTRLPLARLWRSRCQLLSGSGITLCGRVVGSSPSQVRIGDHEQKETRWLQRDGRRGYS
jgi:hypothetical protein